MRSAQTFALVSAALATLTTAQPHSHGHAHFHHEREAEADPQMAVGRPVGATGNILQEVTMTQTATAQWQHTTTVPPEAWKPSTTAAAFPATQQPSKQQPTQQQPTQQQPTQQQPTQQQPTQQQHTTIQTSFKSNPTASAVSSASMPKSSSGSSPGGGGSSGSPIVKIINQCSKAIWIGEGNNAMQQLQAGASPFTAPLSGSAISWKMGWDSQASWTANNAEIEFTVTGSNSMTYDLSLQKGNPFLQYGQKLELSDSSCKPVHCLPGVFPCPDAYNTEADNSKVGQPSLPCSMASITFTACSG